MRDGSLGKWLDVPPKLGETTRTAKGSDPNPKELGRMWFIRTAIPIREGPDTLIDCSTPGLKQSAKTKMLKTT
jgi:hypothetical protein